MSVADEARKILQDVTGMWWPDADVGGLRDAAKAWRDFADDVEDVTAAANKAARSLIENNRGEAISAFDDPFWRRYYYDKRGWLRDLSDGARDMAKALDAYADAVHGAKNKLEHKLEIVGGTILVGTGLAFFTGGLSEGPALAAATAVTELAGTLGVAVTAEIASIAGTTLATAAIAGIESIAVDLAVAQPIAIATGEQSGGLDLDEARQAGVYGALTGGLLGGAGATFRAAQNAGGWTELLGGARVPGVSPQLAMPGGLTAGADDFGMLLRDGEQNAWPRSKRKGRVNPQYRADVAGDEGKNGSHTLTKHVEVTTQDLRARLRAEPARETVSRYVDEASAQRSTDAVVLKRQKEIDAWLAKKKGAKLELEAHLEDHTGLSLTRVNFRNGLPPEWVKGARVILKRDSTAPMGYRVLTSYPVP
ncbi:RNase A-like domain-containing protein [Streptomyces sp. NPDC006333]|uniref:RNase A-like domain-containing protein n=1 Tax=Streptomyces sp. NPDC006333 TaxID=3156753 RepID=UPI0033BE670A